jgi:outer membrane protein OmpA-like peptidoglycan-associated protein
MKKWISILVLIIPFVSSASDTLRIKKEVNFNLKSNTELTVQSKSFDIEVIIHLSKFDTLLLFHTNEAQPFDVLTFNEQDYLNTAFERGYCYCEQCLSAVPVIVSIPKGLIRLENKSQYDLNLNIQPKNNNQVNALLENEAVKEKGLNKVALVSGNTIELDKIFFVGGSTQYLDTSLPQLQELLQIMNQNKKLVIQIEGHVNGLYSDTVYYNTLSLGRADAIRMYLMENNVNSRRIKTIGYGNTRMLFPKPRTDFEMLRNRRVEVRILSN